MNVAKVAAPGIRKTKVINVACDLSILLSIYLSLQSVPPNYLHIICDFCECWAFLTYDGVKYPVNVTEGLIFFRGYYQGW